MNKISLLFVFVLISLSCRENTGTPGLKTQKTEIPEVVYSKSDHTLQAFDLTEVLKYNGIASLDIGKELPDLKTLEKKVKHYVEMFIEPQTRALMSFILTNTERILLDVIQILQICS